MVIKYITNLKMQLLIISLLFLNVCFSQQKVDSFFVYDFNDDNFYFSEELNKGKPIFINFFATWCGPCRFELPEIQKLADLYNDVSFFVVHVDNLYQNNIKLKEPPRSEVIKILRKRGLLFENKNILYDKYAVVAEKFNIKTLPQSFLISSDGQILAQYNLIDDNSLMSIKRDMDSL